MTKTIKPEYIAKANLLTDEETERLLSRMGGKLPRRIEKRKLTQVEALAIQLEMEDEQLQAWRKVMQSLRKKEEAKKEEKSKTAEKSKTPLKSKAPIKAKAPLKAKGVKKAGVEPGK